MTALSIRKRLADTTVELPSGGSMMIAGLVRDDVRQAVNGLPGLSKMPVLGTLFRSRDFVRNETELVIIVTPYLARPVARNELAKPDDNFNAASDGAGHVPRPRQPRLRHHADQQAQRPLSRRRRLHLQVIGDHGPCLTQRRRPGLSPHRKRPVACRMPQPVLPMLAVAAVVLLVRLRDGQARLR